MKWSAYIQTNMVVVCFAVFSFADTTIVNEQMSFSAYLPDNWTAAQVSDSSVLLYDTTGYYKSDINIKRYYRSSADFPTPEDWTRAHFIAYLLVVENSWDPFGSVLYFDSIQSTQSSLWAPEAFCEFYTIDTALGSWDEYMRYTANGDYGYEIYAIGDTSDMKNNFGFYSAIIQQIEIGPGLSNVRSPKRTDRYGRFNISSSRLPSGVYDLRGKRHLPAVRKPKGAYLLPSRELVVKIK
ncbi:MAG: hypothetical protein ACOCW1_04220 [Chitinispirillaceae bacterium]